MRFKMHSATTDQVNTGPRFRVKVYIPEIEEEWVVDEADIFPYENSEEFEGSALVKEAFPFDNVHELLGGLIEWNFLPKGMVIDVDVTPLERGETEF